MNDVRFSDDGSPLATGGDDGALKVWDPTTGELISSVLGRGPALGQSFDASGSLLAGVWPDEGTLRVVDPVTGRVVQKIDGLDTLPLDTALSPDGQRVAVGMITVDEAAVFDVATGDELFRLPRHHYSVQSVAWSPDGRWIATAAGDSAVRVWDAATGRLEARLLGHTGVVITVDWSADSRRLVSGGSDGTARVWEVGTTASREILTLAAQQTRSGTFAAFSPDGNHVITGDTGITAVKTWDVQPLGGAEVLNLHTDFLAPVDVVYLPDGRIVAPIAGGSVAIWNEAKEELRLGPGGGSPEAVTRIAVSDDGSRIATVRNFSDQVSVWDPVTGNALFDAATEPSGEISGIDWSPDGEHLVVGNFDGHVSVVDAAGRTVEAFTEKEPTSIEGISFSPDGRWIATAVASPESPNLYHVSLWDWRAGRVERTIDGIGATTVAFDPTGSRLAVGLFDGFVEVFTVANLERVDRFAAHSGAVGDLVFSPDGERIATAGEDATARVFDAATGEQQLVLRGHEYLVTGVAFSPDGTRLVSASPDGLVRVWTLDLDDLIRIADQKLTRGLSDDECRQYLHLESCP